MRPLDEDIVVYRGTAGFKEISNDNFISTSLRKHVANGFTTRIDTNSRKTCCLFEITINSGSHFIPILDNTYYPGEDEILLPPNSTFTYVTEEKAIYNPPINVPHFELSNWDRYVLNFFYVVTNDEFQLYHLKNVIVREYMSSLMHVINVENLLSRFHIDDVIQITDDNISMWKMIVKKFGTDVLQLVPSIKTTSNHEAEFINYTPNVIFLDVYLNEYTIDWINNLNILRKCQLLVNTFTIFTEINNLNLKKLVISSHERASLNLSNINAMNLENLKIYGLNVVGDLPIMNLGKLVLDNCGLAIIPQFIYGLVNLIVLDLSNNRITHIGEDVNNLTTLKDLILKNNPVEVFPSITTTSIKRIQMPYNQKCTLNNNLTDRFTYNSSLSSWM